MRLFQPHLRIIASALFVVLVTIPIYASGQLPEMRQDTGAEFSLEEFRQANENFLAENATRPEVTVTGSGLQYETLRMGEGAIPTLDDTVEVHYRGLFIDGTEFDNSYSREIPVQFPVTGAIPGWTEALQLMPEGSQFRLVIPAELAYGETGAGNYIPPYATLIYEMELLRIVPPPPTPEEGIAFLQSNAEREEVTVLENGLQFEILEPDEGSRPADNEIVEIRYTGTLVDGTIFDSSENYGETVRFPLDAPNLPAWMAGIKEMTVGSSFRFFIPAELAFGDIETPAVPANSAVIYEVVLVGISPPPPTEEEGRIFLEENRSKEDVQVTGNGLQYKVINAGEGNTPSANDTVEVHYVGRLINGNVFESSYQAGEPTRFSLQDVIAGWQEGLQLMQEGANYRFYIPPELAYGNDGWGTDIPPGSALIFDIELLRIVPPPPSEAEGLAFLQENANRPEVNVLQSGLQYEVLAEGSGPKPIPGDLIEIHFEGQLLDGTVFDSSLGGAPIVFPLQGVIPGWMEGIQLMSPGSRYRFYISPELGYGDDGALGVPPGSALIYEIELISLPTPQ